MCSFNFCVQWLYVWSGTRRYFLDDKVRSDNIVGSWSDTSHLLRIHTYGTICMRPGGWVLGGVFTFAGATTVVYRAKQARVEGRRLIVVANNVFFTCFFLPLFVFFHTETLFFACFCGHGLDIMEMSYVRKCANAIATIGIPTSLPMSLPTRLPTSVPTSLRALSCRSFAVLRQILGVHF